MEIHVWAEWWRSVGEDELRAVVMKEWDPIGVADEPLCRSEYDNYLGQIVKRLRAGATDAAPAGYLGTVATEAMGLGASPDHDLRAARRLREWYDNSISRFASA